MVVESGEFRLWIRLRHQDGRCPQTAADIGNTSSVFQFFIDPIERRNPGGNKVRGVAWTEESLSADEQFGMVFVPTETLSRLESLGKRLLSLDSSQRRLKRPRHERRAVVVRHSERLFLAEVEF